MHIIKIIKVCINNIFNIDDRIRREIIVNNMELSSNGSTRSLVENSNNATVTIISLTTYGDRIHHLHLTLESIARQIIKVDKVILWLDEDEFSEKNIPQRILNFKTRGLEIKFCHNIKSFKKLIPSSQLYPKANIITIDDDYIYPSDMVEILMKEHEIYPDVILGHRAHYIKFTRDGNIAPYNNWEYETQKEISSHRIFITSGGGTLFPANCFKCHPYSDENIFMSICGDADDVWFKAMAILNNIKCKKVSGIRRFTESFIPTNFSEDVGLWVGNVKYNSNDTQIREVFDKFQLYDQLI